MNESIVLPGSFIQIETNKQKVDKYQYSYMHHYLPER